jgi:DNA polymerase I
MKILIIDTYNMIHRARFARTSASYGFSYVFMRSLRAEVEKHNPDKVYLVLEGKPVKRLNLNPEYKGTRTKTTDDNFFKQKDIIFNLIKLLPVTIAHHPYHECDDVIAHIATNLHNSDNVTIVSSDTDFLQIVNNNIKLWNPISKSYREAQANYVKFKALKGDKSDNIIGIKGVGKKTADLLANDKKAFDTYMNKKPEALKIYEYAYKQIIFESLDPLEKLSLKQFSYNSENLVKEFNNNQFYSILNKGWKKWNNTWEKLEEANAKIVE